MKYYLLFIFAVLCGHALAEESKSVQKESRKEKTYSNFTAAFNLTYNSLTITSGGSISGPGMELNLAYSLSKKWAVGGGIKQMTLGSGGSGTGFSFRGTYAIWGKLFHENEKVYYDKDLIVDSKDSEETCLCAQVMGSQYYLNSSSNTVPFTGYGAGIFYKYPTIKYSNLLAGLQYETMQNTETLSAITMYFGVEFRI